MKIEITATGKAGDVGSALVAEWDRKMRERWEALRAAGQKAKADAEYDYHLDVWHSLGNFASNSLYSKGSVTITLAVEYEANV